MWSCWLTVCFCFSFFFCRSLFLHWLFLLSSCWKCMKRNPFVQQLPESFLCASFIRSSICIAKLCGKQSHGIEWEQNNLHSKFLERYEKKMPIQTTQHSVKKNSIIMNNNLTWKTSSAHHPKFVSNNLIR